MDFKCSTDGSHKFSLDPPEDKKGVAWAWKGIVKCPYCGSAELEHVFAPASLSTGVDLVKARHENRDMTIAAQEAAGRARAEDLKNNPEKSLAPIQGVSKFGGDTIKVKKSLYEAIRQSTPESALIKDGGDITPEQ